MSCFTTQYHSRNQSDPTSVSNMRDGSYKQVRTRLHSDMLHSSIVIMF